MDEIYDLFEDGIDGWYSKGMKKRLSEEWVNLISMKNWTSFITLTFREQTYTDTANHLFYYLVRRLNEDVYGKRYKNSVIHSYFSYVKGIEFQVRGVIHFHVLVDRPVNYKLIHSIWNEYAGFAQTTMIKSYVGTINYISKYAIKDGEIEPYFAKKLYEPVVKPAWWIRAEILQKLHG